MVTVPREVTTSQEIRLYGRLSGANRPGAHKLLDINIRGCNMALWESGDSALPTDIIEVLQDISERHRIALSALDHYLDILASTNSYKAIRVGKRHATKPSVCLLWDQIARSPPKWGEGPGGSCTESRDRQRIFRDGTTQRRLSSPSSTYFGRSLGSQARKGWKEWASAHARAEGGLTNMIYGRNCPQLQLCAFLW